MKNAISNSGKRATKAVGDIARTFDLSDVFAFGGLGMLCYGIAQIYPPAAWIVGGVVFMYLGMRG